MKSCFVVSVIGKEGSDQRKHADTLFKYIIEPVAKEAGYYPERGDHDDRPGMIPQQIVEKLFNSDLVIADLTYWNPNVYYEIGIRHFTGKRFVQIAKNGTALPFDVGQVRSAQYGFEVGEAEAGKLELFKQIKAVEGMPEPIMNPVTQTQLSIRAERSGDDTKTMLAALLDKQEHLAALVASSTERMIEISRYLQSIRVPQVMTVGPRENMMARGAANTSAASGNAMMSGLFGLGAALPPLDPAHTVSVSNFDAGVWKSEGRREEEPE